MPKPQGLRAAVCASLRRIAGWTTPSRLLILALVFAAPLPAAAQMRVTATWQANEDGLTAGYEVFVGTSPGVPLAMIDTGLATSAQLPLPAGGVYYISVRAYTAQGLMGPSTGHAIIDLSAPPGVPSAFRADVDGPRATLNWFAPGSGGMPSNYLLSVGTAPGAANLLSGHAVGQTESVSSDLAPGVYYARLQAANLMGVGPASPEIAFEIGGGYLPLGPSSLNANWQGTHVQLSWTPPSGSPEEMPAAYVIEAGSTSGAADIGSINVGTATSYVVDVPPGTFYVRVRGVNARGISGASNEVVVTGRGAPGSPRNLSATGGGNVVNLRWSAPNSGGPVTSYVIEAGSGPGLSNLGVVDVGHVTTFTTAVPSGTYYVRVRAVNARGASAPSNQVTVPR